MLPWPLLGKSGFVYCDDGPALGRIADRYGVSQAGSGAASDRKHLGIITAHITNGGECVARIDSFLPPVVPLSSKHRPRRTSALRAAQPERHTEAEGNGAPGMCIRTADECGVVREQVNSRKRVEEAAAGPPIVVA